jgi:hypothetical protein
MQVRTAAAVCAALAHMGDQSTAATNADGSADCCCSVSDAASLQQNARLHLLLAHVGGCQKHDTSTHFLHVFYTNGWLLFRMYPAGILTVGVVT